MITSNLEPSWLIQSLVNKHLFRRIGKKEHRKYPVSRTLKILPFTLSFNNWSLIKWAHVEFKQIIITTLKCNRLANHPILRLSLLFSCIADSNHCFPFPQRLGYGLKWQLRNQGDLIWFIIQSYLPRFVQPQEQTNKQSKQWASKQGRTQPLKWTCQLQ